MWSGCSFKKKKPKKKVRDCPSMRSNWFEALNVTELKTLLAAAKLPVSGSKPTQIERLLAAPATQEYAIEVPSNVPLSKYGAAVPVSQLKERCKSQGLAVSGNKLTLVTRLVQHTMSATAPQKEGPPSRAPMREPRVVQAAQLLEQSEEDSEEEAETFEVEKIVGKRLREGNLTEYCVKWKGYGIDECTWESTDNLTSASVLVASYEAPHGSDHEDFGDDQHGEADDDEEFVPKTANKKKRVVKDVSTAVKRPRTEKEVSSRNTKKVKAELTGEALDKRVAHRLTKLNKQVDNKLTWKSSFSQSSTVRGGRVDIDCPEPEVFVQIFGAQHVKTKGDKLTRAFGSDSEIEGAGLFGKSYRYGAVASLHTPASVSLNNGRLNFSFKFSVRC